MGRATLTDDEQVESDLGLKNRAQPVARIGYQKQFTFVNVTAGQWEDGPTGLHAQPQCQWGRSPRVLLAPAGLRLRARRGSIRDLQTERP